MTAKGKTKFAIGMTLVCFVFWLYTILIYGILVYKSIIDWQYVLPYRLMYTFLNICGGISVILTIPLYLLNKKLINTSGKNSEKINQISFSVSKYNLLLMAAMVLLVMIMIFFVTGPSV